METRFCIEYVNPRHPLRDNGSINVRYDRVLTLEQAEHDLTLILSFGAKILDLYMGNVVEGKTREWNPIPMIVDKDDWFTTDWLKSIESMQEESDLTKNEQKISNAYCRKVRDKRILPTLKGELKHKFINEFNTLYQTLDMQLCDKCMKEPLKELCLAFATWGAYNLKDIGRVDEEERTKMDSLQEEPVSEDLENEMDNYIKNNFYGSGTQGFFSNRTHEELDCIDVVNIARHFANWRKQQMMAKAVNGEVTFGKSLFIPSLGLVLDKEGLDYGDKVKLVIIKDE